MPLKTHNHFIAKGLRLRSLPLLISALLLVAFHAGNSSSGVPDRTSNSAVVSETAGSAYAFVNSIGVNTHLNYFDTKYGDFPFVQRELESIGIRHLRDGLHLQNADYNNTLYGRWVQLGSIGIRFDGVLDPRSNLGAVSPSLLSQFDQLTGHALESVEGPNELDISNLQDWASIDRSYQEAIFTSERSMANARPIKVIGPSMAAASNGSQLSDIQDRIDEGNLHPYPAAKMPSAVFPEQTDFAKKMSGDKQIVFTESGYHNALNDHRDQPAVSEAAAAKYIPRLFLEDYARGIARTYLYEFLDEAADPRLTKCQMHWGLIRADGSEKPAFTAMKNLIGELKDGSEPARLHPLAWSLSAKNENTHHLLLEKADGELDLVLWQEVTSYDYVRQVDIANAPLAGVLTLGSQARSITLYEPAAQAQALHVYTDVKSVPIEIPDDPLVVKIRLR
jgi:hypothetical protein